MHRVKIIVALGMILGLLTGCGQVGASSTALSSQIVSSRAESPSVSGMVLDPALRLVEQQYAPVYYSPDGLNYVRCVIDYQENEDNPGKAFLNGKDLVGDFNIDYMEDLKAKPVVLWLDNNRFMFWGEGIYDIKTRQMESLDLPCQYDYKSSHTENKPTLCYLSLNSTRDKLAYCFFLSEGSEDNEEKIIWYYECDIYDIAAMTSRLVYHELYNQNYEYSPKYSTLFWDEKDNLYFEFNSKDEKWFIMKAEEPQYKVSAYQEGDPYNFSTHTRYFALSDGDFIKIYDIATQTKVCQLKTWELVFGDKDLVYWDTDTSDLVLYNLESRSEQKRWKCKLYKLQSIILDYSRGKYIVGFYNMDSGKYETYELVK